VAGHHYSEHRDRLTAPFPLCSGEYTHELGALLVCPECAHEWEAAPSDEAPESVLKDAVGNVLADDDTVIVTQNLKVKGTQHPSRWAPRSAPRRLVDVVDGHDIDCLVDGFGRGSSRPLW
jgi:protein PhnA